MAGSDQFLKLRDQDGDDLYVLNDLMAIWTKADKTSIGSMLEPQVRVAKSNECRGVVSRTTGEWAVANSYEEILAEIDRATECESSE